jgi:hypothetical protein
MENKPATINRYRDAVKDPPPNGWVGGILLDGNNLPNCGTYLEGKYWMVGWGDKLSEVLPVKWLSENEPAIPKVTWDELKARINTMKDMHYKNPSLSIVQREDMVAQLDYIVKFMEELEDQNG